MIYVTIDLWSEFHYNDVIMGTTVSQITSLTIVFSTVYSDTNQRKHQSSASLAFVRGIHWGPVNSPHKWPVTRKMFPLDNVIMWKWHLPGANELEATMQCCVIYTCCAIITVKAALWFLMSWCLFGTRTSATTMMTLVGQDIQEDRKYSWKVMFLPAEAGWNC